MKNTSQKLEEAIPDPSRSTTALPVDAEDLLDWDAATAAPPPRRSGTVRVTLRYAGRSKPIPVPDPDREDERAA